MPSPACPSALIASIYPRGAVSSVGNTNVFHSLSTLATFSRLNSTVEVGLPSVSRSNTKMLTDLCSCRYLSVNHDIDDRIAGVR